MKPEYFIGRDAELDQLVDLSRKRIASLVVVTGRRRVGKSRLIAEFAKKKKFFGFSGLTPAEGVTAQSQRDHFMRQFTKQTGLPFVSFSDWSDVFSFLADKIKQDRVVVAFDEISWMAHDDTTFLAKLKVAWDEQFKSNRQLILILCGSISSWIEKNIMSSTGFFGRISLKINLKQLPLFDCNHLLNAIGFKYSPFEKLLMLTITGGVPWYIEQINPTQSALENIKRLCFSDNGVLVEDYQHIFHNLFGRRGCAYSEIVKYIVNGMHSYDDVQRNVNYEKSGSLSEYMRDLELAGFTRRHFSWNIKSGLDSKFSLYRLSDNYLRFYLKYISPKINKIKQGLYADTSPTSLPGWNAMMGLQFENLVLNNPQILYSRLGLKTEDIVAAGPYIQKKNSKQLGCQIDYLIQTKLKTLYVCEIKLSQKMIGCKVMDDVSEKMKRLHVPRGFACVPVLLYAGELSDELVDTGYFAKCVNYLPLFEQK